MIGTEHRQRSPAVFLCPQKRILPKDEVLIIIVKADVCPIAEQRCVSPAKDVFTFRQPKMFTHHQSIQEVNAMLTINKAINEGKAEFHLEGRLDTNTSPELEKELNESLEGITDLTINMENLDYISSAGLRVLLSTQKAMAKKGELKVTNVNDTIMDIFEMTGFTEILTIEQAGKKKKD